MTNHPIEVTITEHTQVQLPDTIDEAVNKFGKADVLAWIHRGLIIDAKQEVRAKMLHILRNG